MLTLRNTLRSVVTALCITLALVSGAHAQKWVKLAPFPDASEELYGISSGGKLYVMGGLAPG